MVFFSFNHLSINGLFKRSFKNSTGFTLIELLVVIGIIAVLTALVLPNFQSGDRTLALYRVSHKLAQDLRRVQGFAISAQKFSGDVPAGYGIYFDLSQPDQYILFADINGDKDYSGSSENVEIIVLERQTEIAALYPASGTSLSVVFYPPDPSVFFAPDGSPASIIIKVLGASQQSVVQVNKAGLISVD